MDMPVRKHPRLKNYDYGKNGCYFVTVCVKNNKSLLGTVKVGRDGHIPPQVILSKAGETVEKYILNIDKVLIENYIIMPDHIHLLLMFYSSPNDDGGVWAHRSTRHTVVRSLKTLVTKDLGYSIWQTSYYDRVIQNEIGYLEALQYIDENPLKYVLKETNNL